MKPRIICPLLVLMMFSTVTGDAAAQGPAHSFADLTTVVSEDEPVVVWDAYGRKVTGRVVSVSGDRLEIRRRRWNFRTEHRVFTEATARRVDKRDSTWNGELIGAGAGAFAAWAKCKITAGNPDDWWCLAWIPIAPVVGTTIGHAVDAALNEPLFMRIGNRVALRPVVGRTRAGVAASLRF